MYKYFIFFVLYTVIFSCKKTDDYSNDSSTLIQEPSVYREVEANNSKYGFSTDNPNYMRVSEETADEIINGYLHGGIDMVSSSTIIRNKGEAPYLFISFIDDNGKYHYHSTKYKNKKWETLWADSLDSSLSYYFSVGGIIDYSYPELNKLIIKGMAPHSGGAQQGFLYYDTNIDSGFISILSDAKRRNVDNDYYFPFGLPKNKEVLYDFAFHVANQNTEVLGSDDLYEFSSLVRLPENRAVQSVFSCNKRLDKDYFKAKRTKNKDEMYYTNTFPIDINSDGYLDFVYLGDVLKIYSGKNKKIIRADKAADTYMEYVSDLVSFSLEGNRYLIAIYRSTGNARSLAFPVPFLYKFNNGELKLVENQELVDEILEDYSFVMGPS